MDWERDFLWDEPCCTVHLLSEILAVAVGSSNYFPRADTSQQTSPNETTYTYNIYKAERLLPGQMTEM